MKVLFVYPRFNRHADDHPELREHVPMNEYLGSPSLGIAMLAAATPDDWEVEYRDDRLADADRDTDADLVAFSAFTPAATRMMALADRFRARGVPTVAGGIFATVRPDEVAEHADAVVVGEGEPVWRQVLADVRSGRLAPRYRADPLRTETLPLPDLSLYFGAETDGFRPDDYPLQLSRGCPLACEACAVPVTMAPCLRLFPLEHVLGQLATLVAAGRRACLTEDTTWLPGQGRALLEALFDRLAGHPAVFSYAGISVPMLLTCPPRLLDKAREAGIGMFYLVTGFDRVTRMAAAGDERARQRFVRAVQVAQDHGIEPYTSFLLGNDDDDAGTVDRMLGIADDAGIRKAEFAIATPYPGTPRWLTLERQGRLLHRDWARYNDANCVFQPRHLTPEQVEDGYLRLWREFYATRGHLADLPVAERTIQF